jgi:hypothetical protein
MSLLDGIKKFLTGEPSSESRQDKPSSTSKASAPPMKAADVESKCPHCANTLEKRPLRKKRCPNCGNYIYVRSTPTGQNKVLVTEQQAAEIDKEWQRYHQEKLLHSDPEYRREHEQVKAQLMFERGTEPSVGDIRWVLAKKHILQHARDGDWGLYRNTKLEMAQQLQGEQKLMQALRTYLEVCYLDANGPCNRGAKPFDPGQAIIAPGIIRQVRELSRSLGLQSDEVKGLFIEAADIYHNGLPVDSVKAWDQILLELRAPRIDNPGLL